MVEAAPPTINVDNDSAHQALVQQLPHVAAYMSINDNPWLREYHQNQAYPFFHRHKKSISMLSNFKWVEWK